MAPQSGSAVPAGHSPCNRPGRCRLASRRDGAARHRRARPALPGHIETRPNWMMSLAGGVTGIMTVLHGSLSEYVLDLRHAGGAAKGSPVVIGSRSTTSCWPARCGRTPRRTSLSAAPSVPATRLSCGAARPRVSGSARTLGCLEYGRGAIPSALPSRAGRCGDRLRAPDHRPDDLDVWPADGFGNSAGARSDGKPADAGSSY